MLTTCPLVGLKYEKANNFLGVNDAIMIEKM